MTGLGSAGRRSRSRSARGASFFSLTRGLRSRDEFSFRSLVTGKVLRSRSRSRSLSKEESSFLKAAGFLIGTSPFSRSFSCSFSFLTEVTVAADTGGLELDAEAGVDTTRSSRAVISFLAFFGTLSSVLRFLASRSCSARSSSAARFLRTSGSLTFTSTVWGLLSAEAGREMSAPGRASEGRTARLLCTLSGVSSLMAIDDEVAGTEGATGTDVGGRTGAFSLSLSFSL
ncbi:hypothetical protein DACRYDRAFT_20843, partial [Dacryopinax primogenitus]